MLRSFIQISALVLALGAAIFLLKANLGLSPETIAKLSTTHWGHNEEIAKGFARQSADTRVGIILMIISFVLQTANAVWPLRWKDFNIDWRGVSIAIIACVLFLTLGSWYSKKLSERTYRKSIQIIEKKQEEKVQKKNIDKEVGQKEGNLEGVVINTELAYSLLGTLLVVWVAIFSIQKTAVANRVSRAHAEMTSCLAETVLLLQKDLSFLSAITRHVTYCNRRNDEVIETAYARYWRQVNDISDKFNSIEPKQLLVFPEEIHSPLQEILRLMNSAKDLAAEAKPDDKNVYPETEGLDRVVSEAIARYRSFINLARQYIGTDQLQAISVGIPDFLRPDEKVSEEPKC